jgi:hypothetical protein
MQKMLEEEGREGTIAPEEEAVQKWEYLHVTWGHGAVQLYPAEKLDGEWLNAWVGMNYPESTGGPARLEMEQPEPDWFGTAYYCISNLRNLECAVAMALIQHLGSKGWEAVDLSGSLSSGSAWFKQPRT